MKFLLGRCKEALFSVVHSVVIPIVVVLGITGIFVFALAYPSYLNFHLLSADSPHWSAYFDYEERSEQDIDKIREALQAELPQASVVKNVSGDALISTDRIALESAKDANLMYVQATLLNDPEKKIYPSDVFIPSSHVLEGDPRTDDGLIIDALMAKKLGVSAGDKLYIAFKFPENSSTNQSFLASSVINLAELSLDPQTSIDNVTVLEKPFRRW